MITAQYLPGMGQPAICIDGVAHTMDHAAAEKFIEDFSFAVLRSRIAAKHRSVERRLGTPESEVEQLLQMVDHQLDTPETFPKSSPASEVKP